MCVIVRFFNWYILEGETHIKNCCQHHSPNVCMQAASLGLNPYLPTPACVRYQSLLLSPHPPPRGTGFQSVLSYRNIIRWPPLWPRYAPTFFVSLSLFPLVLRLPISLSLSLSLSPRSFPPL